MSCEDDNHLRLHRDNIEAAVKETSTT